MPAIPKHFLSYRLKGSHSLNLQRAIKCGMAIPELLYSEKDQRRKMTLVRRTGKRFLRKISFQLSEKNFENLYFLRLASRLAHLKAFEVLIFNLHFQNSLSKQKLIFFRKFFSRQKRILSLGWSSLRKRVQFPSILKSFSFARNIQFISTKLFHRSSAVILANIWPQVHKKNLWPRLKHQKFIFKVGLECGVLGPLADKNVHFLDSLQQLDNTALPTQTHLELSFYNNPGRSELLDLSQKLGNIDSLSKLTISGAIYKRFSSLFRSLSNHRQLKNISITFFNEETPILLKNLSHLAFFIKSLRSLTISTSFFEDLRPFFSFSKQLGYLTDLTSLDLNLKIEEWRSDNILSLLSKSLAELTNLQSLRLCFLKSFQHSELQDLDFQGVLDSIGSLKSLSLLFLIFSGFQINDESFAGVCRAIGCCSQLQQLRLILYNSNVGDSGILAFQEILPLFERIEDMMLSINSYEQIDSKVLIQFMKSLGKLNYLSQLHAKFNCHNIEDSFSLELKQAIDELKHISTYFLELNVPSANANLATQLENLNSQQMIKNNASVFVQSQPIASRFYI